MERKVEEGLVAAKKGGPTKTKGEEGSISPNPTRDDQGNPASQLIPHVGYMVESTHYAGATVTDLEDQSPLAPEGEGTPPQLSQRDGVESLPLPAVSGFEYQPHTLPKGWMPYCREHQEVILPYLTPCPHYPSLVQSFPP